MNPELLRGLIVPIGFVAIFYFFAIRPQKKKEIQVKEMRNELRVGDNVITIGGIHGKIVVAKEDILTIETGTSKTKLDITRWSVGSVTNKDNA